MIFNYIFKTNISYEVVEYVTYIIMGIVGPYSIYSVYYLDKCYNIANILLIYFIIETFFIPFNKKDLIVHHIFAIMMSMYGHINDLGDNICYVAKNMIELEKSNFVLVISYFARKYCKIDIVKNIINVLFMILFVKLRLIDYYYSVLTNDIYLEKLNANTNFTYIYTRINMYGLYMLNIFWTFKILKIFYKTIINNKNNKIE